MFNINRHTLSSESDGLHANGVPFVSPRSSLRDLGDSMFGYRALKGRDINAFVAPLQGARFLSLLPRVSRTRPWANETGAFGAKQRLA